MKHLLAAAAAGVATGMRSTIGVGALVETASPGLPAALTRTPARIGAGVAVAGELVGDKLPRTPSRLDPPGLLARVVMGAAAGAVLARAASRPMLPAALVAAGAAVVGAKVGHDVRARASQRVPPLVAAVAEDAIACTLAFVAARSVG